MDASTIAVALKEWAVVCELLLAGRQVVLLRKGGIHEPRRGFAIEHDAFYLYPNVEHQRRDELRPELHPLLDTPPPAPQASGAVVVPGYCRVVDVLDVGGDPGAGGDPAPARGLQALQANTCWTWPFFERRLRYKPERPLFAVTVRAYRFAEPASLPYHRLYAGCRSWVPLRDAVPAATLAGATPALDDDAFARQRRAVRDALAG
jgi:hypothetical protein